MKKIYLILLMLIPIIFLSVFLRMQPLSLSMIDDNVRSNIYTNIKINVQDAVIQQYPNLPKQELDAEVNAQFIKLVDENKDAIELEIAKQSAAYKDYYRLPNGHPYLSDIDTYYWYYLARYYDNTGHMGVVVNGTLVDPLMRGGFNNAETVATFHPMFEVWIYRLVHLFNRDYTLLQAVYITSVLICALGIIPMFFLGRRIAGYMGGIIAGVIAAVHPALIARTAAGVADTDPWHFLLPVTAIWLLFEGYYAQRLRYKLLLFGGVGFIIALHQSMWGGWWYTFVFIVASLSVLTLVSFIRKSDWKTHLIPLGTVVGSTFLFIIMYGLIVGKGFMYGISRFGGAFFSLPMRFIHTKSVAIASLWPNVMTTVAELNPSALNLVINTIGMFLFYLAIIGILALFFMFYWKLKKGEDGNLYLLFGTLLAIWFVAGTYASIQSLRFTAILVPAIAFSISSLVGIIWLFIKEKLPLWMLITICVIIAILLSPLVYSGYSLARTEAPMMNDAWYNTLTAIRDDSTQDNSVITSWWDFGHWFKAVAERPVIFDGSDQGRRIYWVGKLLLTNNENESVNILKMLTCDKNLDISGPTEYLEKQIGTIDAIDIISSIHREKGEYAMDGLYCDSPRTNYVILSDDMIGKAGVWGHFGSWDFRRAQTYNDLKDKKLSEVNASDIDAYYEIQSTPADQWISPWPQYLSGWIQCVNNSGIFTCPVRMNLGDNILDSVIITETPKFKIINKNGGIAMIEPADFAMLGPDGIVKMQMKGEFNYDVLLDEANGRIIIMDPLLTNSMFTNLYFLKGKYYDRYELFHEEPGILVYKVKW